jgi:hypothetical protein
VNALLPLLVVTVSTGALLAGCALVDRVVDHLEHRRGHRGRRRTVPARAPRPRAVQSDDLDDRDEALATVHQLPAPPRVGRCAFCGGHR